MISLHWERNWSSASSTGESRWLLDSSIIWPRHRSDGTLRQPADPQFCPLNAKKNQKRGKIMWLEQCHSINNTMFSGKRIDWLLSVVCTNNTRLSVYLKIHPNSIKNMDRKYDEEIQYSFPHLPSNFLQVMLEERTHVSLKYNSLKYKLA